MAVTLELPEELEKEVEKAGLLAPDTVEAIFREQLRREGHGDRREATNANAIAGWLPDALRDLDGMDEEINEEDLPPISDDMRTNARRLLVALGRQPVAPMVCPTEYGEISLYFKARHTRGAIHIVLDNRGEAAWYCVIPGKKGYGRHKDPAELPIDFLLTRLKSLASAPISG